MLVPELTLFGSSSHLEVENMPALVRIVNNADKEILRMLKLPE
jgi:hypothetical protein